MLKVPEAKKAMEQFKANKLIEEYNLLIAGLIEYKSGFPIVKGYDTYIASTIMSLNCSVNF